MSEDLEIKTNKSVSIEKYFEGVYVTKEEFLRESRMNSSQFYKEMREMDNKFKDHIDFKFEKSDSKFRWVIGIGITLIIAVFSDILNVAQYFHH